MNVKELINLVNLLSINNNELSQDERDAYVEYLNMANADLYQVAAGGLRSIIKKAEVFYDSVNNYFTLPVDLFLIRSVFANNECSISSGDVDTAPSLASNQYLVIGNQLYINHTYNLSSYLIKIDPSDNVSKNYIQLYYVPNPKRLVENVQDADKETDTPVYPVPYHHFLVKRALYYFYFSNKIFLDKMSYLLNDWTYDKGEMAKFKNYGL